jgi:16S rRNA (cytosine967-C5)-methyltransferase
MADPSSRGLASPSRSPADRGTQRAPLSREMLAAAEAILDLQEGRRLPDALDARTATLPVPSRAPVRDMAYGTVREFGRLQALAARLNSRRPMPRLGALQAVALAQLIAPIRHAAVIVDQAVVAARSLSRGPSGGAAGFINATLRRFDRDRERLLAEVDRDDAARLNYPEWWLSLLRRAYPDDWQAIAEAGNRRAPLTLRVNRRRVEPEAMLQRLAAAGIDARRVGPEAIALADALPVERIPGFAEGAVSVQDAGAQMAAHLLDLAPGQRVLDACAAPGGKAGHILSLASVDLLALDIDPDRCLRIGQNLQREGLLDMPDAPVRVLAADAARPVDWWDGRPFDRILLDAPCTASGIVRRHPDVRWLRRRGDLATLVARQRELLEALWPLLLAGGKLLYATCSVFPEEGEGVVERFCRDRPDCLRQPLHWVHPDGMRQAVSQLLPRSEASREHDGFFYACLSKRQ